MKLIFIYFFLILFSCALTTTRKNSMKRGNNKCGQPDNQIEIVLSGGNDKGAPLDQSCLDDITRDINDRDKLPQFDSSCTTSSTWGVYPAASNYRVPNIPGNCDRASYARQRVLKVIDYFVNKGYNYCHHHVGSWVPPNDSTNRVSLKICPLGDPTKGSGICSVGRDGVWTGIDCTTYTSWVYLFGFGKYLVTNTGCQASSAASPGRVLPYSKDDQDKFLPGDIIYVGNDKTNSQTSITHGILWTGIAADRTNPDSVPFGINTLVNNLPDCQQQAAKNYITSHPNSTIYVISDSHWNGPNYRPFAGWYYSYFSHAKRLIAPDSTLPQNATPAPAWFKASDC